MKVYISGPISGKDDYIENFERAEKYIAGQGFEVVNPTTLPHNHGKTYEEFMREDITELLKCDSIYMMWGWQESKGAKFEYDTAVMCGIIRIYGGKS